MKNPNFPLIRKPPISEEIVVAPSNSVTGAGDQHRRKNKRQKCSEAGEDLASISDTLIEAAIERTARSTARLKMAYKDAKRKYYFQQWEKELKSRQLCRSFIKANKWWKGMRAFPGGSIIEGFGTHDALNKNFNASRRKQQQQEAVEAQRLSRRTKRRVVIHENIDDDDGEYDMDDHQDMSDNPDYDSFDDGDVDDYECMQHHYGRANGAHPEPSQRDGVISHDFLGDKVRPNVAIEENRGTITRSKGGKFASSGEGKSCQKWKWKGKAKKHGNSWVVKEPVISGRGSVIPSFTGHVVYAMQKGELHRGLIKCQNRITIARKLLKWKSRMSAEAVDMIDVTGLGDIAGCIHAHIDWPLICAFVERWQPDTNSFHLPVGEMTILLHDIHYILNIPIDGQIINVVDPKDVDHYIALLFKNDERILTDYKVTKILRTENIIETLEVDTVDDERQARGWLAVALGSLLFTDKSGNRFRPREIVEISNHSTVREYSWGSATLAYLYRQLGLSSRAESKGLSGCLTLLQSWIYEYFPCFRPDREQSLIDRTLPLAQTWDTPLQVRSIARLNKIRRRLDKLSLHDVTWTPYGNRQYISDVPQTVYRGLICYRDTIEPYMPDRCVRQFGYVQKIPPNILAPKYHFRGPSTTSATYSVEWPKYMAVSNWKNWKTSRLQLHEYTRTHIPGSSDDDYMEWYTAVSHPFLVADVSDTKEILFDPTVAHETRASNIREKCLIRSKKEVEKDTSMQDQVSRLDNELKSAKSKLEEVEAEVSRLREEAAINAEVLQKLRASVEQFGEDKKQAIAKASLIAEKQHHAAVLKALPQFNSEVDWMAVLPELEEWINYYKNEDMVDSAEDDDEDVAGFASDNYAQS